MRCAILGFVAGAAFLQTRAALPDPWHLLACALAAFVLLLVLRGSLRPACAACAGSLLGFCWAAMLAHAALAHELGKRDEGRDLDVIGTIANLPHDFGEGVRFQFDVDTVLDTTARVPPKIALSWYGAGEQIQLRPGERWRLTVRLQRPHGNANPHGFDYEAWLLGQGVRATGYVRPGASNRRLDAFVISPSSLVERSRDTLRARILHALDGKPYAAVIVALVIGDQRGIEQADWDVFNRTGISHLVAISGLHITMIAGLAAYAAASLWRRSFFTSAQLPLLLPAQKVAALAGASAALLYVLLAGFGVPAQRTLYMLSVVALALWCGRLASVSHVLCLALGLVVLLDPWCLLWPGFWLSFGAVGVILYVGVGRIARNEKGWRGALRLAARTQYAVTLGLVPITLLLFAQVSLIGPLANAVAIPVVSFVVTPLALAGSMLPAPVSTPLLLLAHLAIEWLAVALGWLAGLPSAVWSAPSPPAWLFLLTLLGTVWMLAPRGWPHRWVGAVSWLPLFALLPTHPPAGQFRVTAFDVGQGMALLVETERHRLLYDTGPQYAPTQDGATRVLLPYLRARGIHRLDGMIVTHSDIDHAGGALTLLDALQVDWMASSLAPGHPAVRKAAHHRRCVAGQRWTWDGIAFEMLQPSAASYEDASLKANARSCTLRISANGRAILLAADIEAAQEAQLLQAMPDKLRADVLLAPHHGSGTSSTPAFLAAVQPKIGVFQVGHRNRYKHPKRQVYERYGEHGIRRMRTDVSGALVFDFGADITVREYRRDEARYWFDR
ncbi:DNA internalization-related competence protein ComEC/Rec2 [Massilia sp. YIM B02769]|uniref:DNA internalization-related competence protein ComEC/Rec2 n=1 Tax=Massilia sp. YIM B02769 TaxID=3050129 RepID=UPI0025B6308B|nr:DNA internalization-related competence protein ComEC/Rec2 [Massilia sp. YIM B02769]MDN4060952.1 DNA internalization-related competence protein ComEC/Rec2 [Massilia sp. YIM B02769]